MFYVIRIKGWPVLVWLEVRPAPGRYEVLATFDDVLKAVAGFYDAVEHARAAMRPRSGADPDATDPMLDRDPASRGASASQRAVSSNSMSPRPPLAKKSATYESAR